jgi:septum formation protein
MIDLYLASQSPRRRELLRQIGVRFQVLGLRSKQPRAPDADETQHPGESASAYVERIAAEKARAGLVAMAARRLPVRPVLAADTIVVLDDEVLGKPRDAAEAAAFLGRLSGRAHEVRTAVAIGLPELPGADAIRLRATSISKVYFRPLSAAEIEAYCATPEPFDKAGAYGIQGRAGSFAARIEGSYSGIMGLPLAEVAVMLQTMAATGLPQHS